MNFLKSLSFLILALILQQTLVRIISIGSIRPDLVMVVLVAVSMRYGSVVGLFSGLTIGLIQDVYAIEALGANGMAKCMVGYFTGLLDEKVIKVMPATKVLFLAVAFLVHDTVYSLAAGYHGMAFWDAMLHKTVPSGIYTLLVGSLVFYFLVTPSRSESFHS
jgi:rod shape-determining protein MreD